MSILKTEQQPKTYKEVKSKVFELLSKLMLNHYDIEKAEKMSESDIDTAIKKLSAEMDSLDRIEFAMIIEKEFKISISDDDINKIFSIEQVIVCICIAKNIPVPEKAKNKKAYIKASEIKAPTPITIETSNDNISFYQDGKKLSLKDPLISPYIKILKNALTNQR